MSSSDDEEALQEINVDFEFFNPRESDFHSTKLFLTQLFSTDADQLSLSELAQLIVQQTFLGSM